MNPPIDVSTFPTGAPDLAYDEENLVGLALLREDALAAVRRFRWAPAVEDIILAFGLAPIIGLFLVRFAAGITSGEGQGDTESWIVVGDLPTICFETDVTSPVDALRLYCAIAQCWAEAVLGDGDLSEQYPIAAAATDANATALLGRIAFIREKFIPLA